MLKRDANNQDVEMSYDEIAIESTPETAEGEYSNNEENKVGDVDAEKGVDNRYEVEAILENSLIPSYKNSDVHNWYLARYYSVLDFQEHPMFLQAKKVLSIHLRKIQMMDKQKKMQRQNNGIETDSEDEDTFISGHVAHNVPNMPSHMQHRGGVPHVPVGHPGQYMQRMPGSNPGGMAHPTAGPFKYGNQATSKEQILANYKMMVDQKTLQFNEMESRIKTDEQRQFLDNERQMTFRQLKMQKKRVLKQMGLEDSDEEIEMSTSQIQPNPQPQEKEDSKSKSDAAEGEDAGEGEGDIEGEEKEEGEDPEEEVKEEKPVESNLLEMDDEESEGQIQQVKGDTQTDDDNIEPEAEVEAEGEGKTQ